MTRQTPLTAVLQTFRKWCHEGRDMPGYEMGEGVPYLCRLFGLKYENRAHFSIAERINQEHPTLFATLNGPHGWAYLRVLILQMQERELPRKLRKAKQKAWRRNRKLEVENEINTGV